MLRFVRPESSAALEAEARSRYLGLDFPAALDLWERAFAAYRTAADAVVGMVGTRWPGAVNAASSVAAISRPASWCLIRPAAQSSAAACMVR